MLLAFAIQTANQPASTLGQLDTIVLGSILGLLICGLLSIAREMREETADRP